MSGYERNHVGLKDIHRRPMDGPYFDEKTKKIRESLDDFLTRAGFELRRGRVEGYSREVHKQHFTKLLKE